jgi:hypothetical protein
MFNPHDSRVLLDLTAEDLLQWLPRAEDERHEYKSSATTDGDLKNKLPSAASAFWNSGGGLFVVGVEGSGKPDGGIDASVGRQTRRDWLDQAIAQVSPQADYVVHAVEGNGAELNIASGKAVFLVGFGQSEIGPHMAPDHRYYIRAGAHTVAGSHFLVEAVRARRGLTRPLLRSTLRHKPGNRRVIQIGIVALSDSPALDVEITMQPLPPFLEQVVDRFPLRVPVISAQVPFFFDFDLPVFGRDRPSVELFLMYHDLVGREYQTRTAVDVERQMGPVLLATTEAEEIKKELGDVTNSLRTLATGLDKIENRLGDIKNKLGSNDMGRELRGMISAIGKNESHLRDIARKLK